MQTNPAVEQNKNIKWSESSWNQSCRRGKGLHEWIGRHSSVCSLRSSDRWRVRYVIAITCYMETINDLWRRCQRRLAGGTGVQSCVTPSSFSLAAYTRQWFTAYSHLQHCCRWQRLICHVTSLNQWTTDDPVIMWRTWPMTRYNKNFVLL